MKLGEARVADPAANVLTVTGAAPTPVGQGSAELAKDYNPDQPRDWHGRFGSGGGEAKAPRVRAASARDSRNVAGGDASGPFVEGSAAAIRPDLAANIAAAIPGGVAAAGTALETAGSAAQALLANPATAAAATALGLGALAYYAYNHWASSSEPPTAAEAPKEPVAVAGAPAPDPEDPEGARRQDEAGGQTPRQPSYQTGASDGGPGTWTKVNEGLAPEEAAYQQKATGAPQGTVYNVPNPKAPSGVTSFDGYDPAMNTLIDAKYWDKWPIDEVFSSDSVVKQAQSQIDAAKGTNIVWKIASPEKAASVQVILDDNGILGITPEFLRP